MLVIPVNLHFPEPTQESLLLVQTYTISTYLIHGNFCQEKIFANFDDAYHWQKYFLRNFSYLCTYIHIIPRPCHALCVLRKLIGPPTYSLKGSLCGWRKFCHNTKYEPLMKLLASENFVVYGIHRVIFSPL